MTKDFQKELTEKVKEGVKPSDLKKLKRSKSAEDIISSSTPNIPLKKSHSQLELSLTNQPSEKEQISQLKEQVKFQAQTSQNYLQNLQVAQAKISELEELPAQIKQLEEQILQLRLDKIKEFGDYWEKKQALENELELNINEGVSEIKRLENKLTVTNKKKLELQQKLGTAESKQAQLELKLLNNSPPAPAASLGDDYWPLILLAGTYLFSAWLLSKNPPNNH